MKGFRNNGVSDMNRRSSTKWDIEGKAGALQQTSVKNSFLGRNQVFQITSW
jgi:hypothetical protein